VTTFHRQNILKLRHDPGYNDIGLCDTSSITSGIRK